MDLKIDSTIVINGNKLLISQKIKESHFIFKIFGFDVEFKSWITICFQKTSISWQNLWIFRLKAWGWICSFLQCSSNYWRLRASLTANLWFTLCYFLIKSLLKISQSQINDYSVISLSKKHDAELLAPCTVPVYSVSVLKQRQFKSLHIRPCE